MSPRESAKPATTGSNDGESAVEEAQAAPARFHIHWISGLLAACYFGAVGLLAFLGSRMGVSTADALGKSGGPFIVALLFSWLAYRLGGRSNRVGAVVFAIVLIVFGIDRLAGMYVLIGSHARP